MENPFIVAGPIKPEYFCDRKKEAKRIIDCVTTGENIVVMSPRRMGKSKLIDFCLNDKKIKEHYLTISIDILRTSSIQEFTYELGRAVFSQALRKGEKVLRMVVNTLRSINGSFGYDPVNNAPTFNLSLGDITQPQYTLEEIFECIEKIEQHCIIAIDEFQQICYYPDKNMEAVLRTHIQRCSNANFIFAGSERHLMGEMFTEKARPFYNSASIMSLYAIPLIIYTDFVKEMLAKSGKSVKDEVVDNVYQQFDGNTYYMQEVFHDAFNVVSDGGEITQTIVDNVIDTMLQDNDRKFSETLSRLTLPQKELLYAIAEDKRATRLTSANFVKRHQLRSASSVQSALKKLLEYNIVSQSGTEYYVDDILMQHWLTK